MNTLPESIKKRILNEAVKSTEAEKEALKKAGERTGEYRQYLEGYEVGYAAAAEAILSKPGDYGLAGKRKVEADLLWELIKDWQDARDDDNEEYLSKERFSFSDIESDLYDWLKKVDEREPESSTPSSRVQQLEQAAEILEELCHLKDYKDSKGKDAYYTEEQPKLWAKVKEFLKQFNQLK